MVIGFPNADKAVLQPSVRAVDAYFVRIGAWSRARDIAAQQGRMSIARGEIADIAERMEVIGA